MDRFTIGDEPVDSADVRWCFEQHYAELGTDFGYEVETALQVRPPERQEAVAGGIW